MLTGSTVKLRGENIEKRLERPRIYTRKFSEIQCLRAKKMTMRIREKIWSLTYGKNFRIILIIYFMSLL